MRNSRYADESSAFPTEKIGPRRLSLSSLKTIIFVVVTGVIAGIQIFKPNKRAIEAIVGLVLVFILWNLSGFYALLFFIITYPFPFALSLGNSDFIFILIIFIMSLVRTQAGVIRLRSAKMLNIPIALLLLSYFLSFYNVDYASGNLGSNLTAASPFLSAVMLFYLCITYIDGEERLKMVLKAMLISALFVIVFTLLELLFPGRVFIPNWLYTKQELKLVMKGLRVTGPFHDFELQAEFFALNAPIIFLYLIRSKALSARIIIALLLLADLVMMFATITRGAFIVLMIGFIYLAIISRRDLNFFRITVITSAFVFILVCIELFVSRYTVSGSLFERLFATTFKSGIIPENRYGAWRLGLLQGMHHPFIGYGPAWDYSKGPGERFFLPHSVYLYYFNITGLFGLVAFLFFLYRLLRISVRSMGASLVSSPFPQALMKVLHVCLIMFIIDQIKIEYLRSYIYIYFVWLIFALMAATHNIILKNERERVLPVPSS